MQRASLCSLAVLVGAAGAEGAPSAGCYGVAPAWAVGGEFRITWLRTEEIVRPRRDMPPST